MAETIISVITKHTTASWQQAFSRRLAQARFQGTGWESLYATLIRASKATARRADPFWVGVELTYPGCSLGYTGVLCFDNAGDALSTNGLQNQTLALEAMRKLWPSDHQLRFLTDVVALRRAARRSCVFAAVVDAASPAALALAQTLAKTIARGNTQTALRVLTLISPPMSRRVAGPVGPVPPTPAPFDVLLRSRTAQAWLEHRDLAVMCALQKSGLIGIDFTDICQTFKQYEHSTGRWVSKRPRPIGAKALGVGRGPGRAERAARKALREIAASFPLAQISGGIIDVVGDLRLKEMRILMETIRAACRDDTQFVIGCDVRGQGPFLKVSFIAVCGERSVNRR